MFALFPTGAVGPPEGRFRRRRHPCRRQRQLLHIAPEGVGAQLVRNLRAGNRAEGSPSCTLWRFGNLSPPPQSPQSPQTPVDAAIFRRSPATRRHSRAPAAHAPSQSASRKHLAPPTSSRALQEDYKSQRAPRTPHHVFSLLTNGWKHRLSLLPPPRRYRANRKGWCVCVCVSV